MTSITISNSKVNLANKENKLLFRMNIKFPTLMGHVVDNAQARMITIMFSYFSNFFVPRNKFGTKIRLIK